MRLFAVQIEGIDLLGDRAGRTHDLASDLVSDDELRQVIVDLHRRLSPHITVDRVCWVDVESGERHIEQVDFRVILDRATRTEIERGEE